MVRDLTKSMVSFSWAMSLFGTKQIANLMTPQSPGQPGHQATTAFDAVTQTTEAQLGEVLQGAFRTGDQLQRGAVDLMSGLIMLDALNPGQFLKMTSDALTQTAGAFSQGMPMPQNFFGGSSQPSAGAGWGPMPPPSSE